MASASKSPTKGPTWWSMPRHHHLAGSSWYTVASSWFPRAFLAVGMKIIIRFFGILLDGRLCACLGAVDVAAPLDAPARAGRSFNESRVPKYGPTTKWWTASGWSTNGCKYPASSYLFIFCLDPGIWYLDISGHFHHTKHHTCSI